MSAAHTRVGNFLRRVPQPAYVMADAQKLMVPATGNRWRELGQSIAALEPSKLVAFSADGTALRAIILDDEPKASGAEPDPSDDDETRYLKTFARLLSDAYEKSSRANQPIVDSAMALIERLTARLTSTENELASVRRAYARLLEDTAHERAEAIAAAAETSGDGDVLSQAVAALASGAMQAKAEQAMTANGKRTTKVANG